MRLCGLASRCEMHCLDGGGRAPSGEGLSTYLDGISMLDSRLTPLNVGLHLLIPFSTISHQVRVDIRNSHITNLSARDLEFWQLCSFSLERV